MRDDDGAGGVSFPIEEYHAMARFWELPEALVGGTQAMRDAGARFLPQEEEESARAHEIRLERSFLFPGLRETIEQASLKPFSRGVRIEDDAPAELLYLNDNCDRRGTSLHDFALSVFCDALTYGLAHVLVDMPALEDGRTRTLAEETQAGIKPFFARLSPVDVIGWRSQMIDGASVLTQLRVKEQASIPAGEYGTENVERFRVYDRDPNGPTTWRLFQRVNDHAGQGKIALIGAGTLTINKIPLVTLYANRIGFMVARPPFEDLGWVNLAHWQSSSDQRNLLRFARTGILFATGITDADLGGKGRKLVLGNRAYRAKDPSANLRWVEHSGAAIAAGRQDLIDLEEKMFMLGLEPMISRTGDPTATAAALDSAESGAPLKTWAVGLRTALQRAAVLAAEWLKIAINPNDVPVEVFTDIGLSLRANADVISLIELRKTGEISRETLLKQLRRRGLFEPEFSIDEESARIDAEGSPLSTLGAAALDTGSDEGTAGDTGEP